MAKSVTVIYHFEDEQWWADSPEIERWSAAAPEFDELVELVEGGVAFALDTDDVEILHRPSPELIDIFAGRTTGAAWRVRVAESFRGLLATATPAGVGASMTLPVACGS